MRMHRVLPALTALIILAPAVASAQEVSRIYTAATVSSRGMLGFYSEPVRGAPAHQRIIIDVVPDSPADSAGLRAGDVLLRLNGLAVSPQLMNAGVQPGDTVVLRVRRDDTERDVTLVAAERSGRFRYAFPDSLDERFTVTFERMRASVDSLARPGVLRRIQSDSGTVVIIGTDTLHVSAGGVGRIRGLTHDSLISRHRIESLPRMWSDSARVHIFTPGEGRTFTFEPGDSSFVHGFEVLRSNTLFGRRAVAGAELAPLNPALAEYFGAIDGVLVLNAAEHTPAERAGLRGGDIIVSVGSTPVRSIADLRRAIDAASDDVTLRVLRHGRNVDITLPR